MSEEPEQEPSGSKPPEQKLQRVPAQLTRAARAWATALGVLILGTGIVAVFVVNRDWGPVSLILIGAVLLLAGLTGRLPYVKLGDKGEIDFSTYEKFFQVLESPPEERAERLEELADAAPAPLAPEVRRLATEAELMGLVRASLPRHVSVSEGIGPGYMKSDAVLIDSVGRKLVLEIDTGIVGRRHYQILRQAIPDLKSMDSQIVGGLIVHTRPMASDVQNLLEESGWVSFLVPNDRSRTMESLREAIQRAFTPEGRAESDG